MTRANGSLFITFRSVEGSSQKYCKILKATKAVASDLAVRARIRLSSVVMSTFPAGRGLCRTCLLLVAVAADASSSFEELCCRAWLAAAAAEEEEVEEDAPWLPTASASSFALSRASAARNLASAAGSANVFFLPPCSTHKVCKRASSTARPSQRLPSSSSTRRQMSPIRRDASVACEPIQCAAHSKICRRARVRSGARRQSSRKTRARAPKRGALPTRAETASLRLAIESSDVAAV